MQSDLFGSSALARCARQVSAVLVIGGLTVAELSAGTPSWQKKAWTEWSDQDCANVLYHSPWGSAHSSTIDGERYQQHSAWSIQFRSALPVRLAVARREQIAAKYSKMSLEQRRAFDQKTQAEIDDSKYADAVVFDVLRSEYQSGANSRRGSPPTAQRCTLMLDNGRGLTSSEPQVIKSDETSVEFTVTFPRTVNNQPLLQNTLKKFQVACGFLEDFDGSKMIFRGKLEY